MCNMETYPDPAIVGKAFVKQYYTQMHKDPSQMHRFYLDQSSFVHGGADMGSEEPVIGQKAIHEKIKSLDLNQCHAKIKQVDSHSTLGNGIVIQVTGELSSGGHPMRAFVQTFVLAPETPKKYYVHNDIFRYQDEDITSESETNEATGDGENPSISEQSADGGDYLSAQETTAKVDLYPQAVDLEVVPGEPTLTSESADLGGAGGGVWEQYNDTTQTTTELQQNGIPEEVEPTTTPQPPTTASQEYVYEPTVDHVTSEPIGHTEGALETEQFTTPTEPETKTAAPSTWASRLAGKSQVSSQSGSQNRPLNSTIVSGSQALPQREPRSRRSEGNSGGSGAASSGGSGGSGSGGGSNRQTQQQYNNKDFAKKGGGSGAGGSMGGGGGGMTGSGSGPMSERRGGGTGEVLPDAWQLFVGGLPPQTLDTEIRAVFEGQGNILDVRVNPKNFAFVVFDSSEPVQRIMATREQFHLNGRRLNIELKRPSARYSGPRSGGGGGGGDRGGDRGDRDRGDRSRPSGGLGGGAGGGGGGGFGGKPRNKGGKR